MQVLHVQDDDQNIRLDVFLTKHLEGDQSRSTIKKLIDGCHVKVNEKRVKAHYKVAAGDDIFLDVPDDFLKPQYIAPENIPLDIFYEDDFLFVINKPIGMIVHPASGCYTGTLVNALLYYASNLSDVNSDIRPGIVHRLDKETSGLILVAKDNITHTRLARQFQRREVTKNYVALVEGNVEFDEGIVNVPIGRHFTKPDKKAVRFDDKSKDSVTHYKVIKRLNNVSWMSLFPKTGRTHQLRVHMAYLGHPILGDDKYGKKSNFSRLALHAQAIGFTHPQTKKYVEFSSIPPQEFFDKMEVKSF